MIYLAGPYSHKDPAIREERFQRLSRAAAKLALQGHVVFSPISMSHPMERHMAETKDSAWWCAFDEAFMEHCDSAVVLMLPGWEESEGVAFEIAWFRARKRPIVYMLAD